jgi:hypothetical protein
VAASGADVAWHHEVHFGMSDQPTSLHYDIAKTLPAHDAFGFQELSDRLVANILQLLAQKHDGGGFVLGLEGRWGSGKSTILNYLRLSLRAALKPNQQFLLDFDPWWLEEDADIVSGLLCAVLDALPKAEARKMAKAVGKLASAAGSLPEGLDAVLKLNKKTEAVGELLTATRAAGGDLGKLMNASKPVRKLRSEVAQKLTDKGFSFVVVIDDLDRLAPDKAIRVMNAIKSIADLPGFIYILAYDPHALGNVLKSYKPPLGADYFEKIINVSISVPPITYSQMSAFLEGLLHPELSEPLQTCPHHQQALVGLLDAPRDAIRLANAANFWIGGKISELFPPDFLLLEAIRLIRPQAYIGILQTSDLWLNAESRRLLAFGLGTAENKDQARNADASRAQAALNLGDTVRDKAVLKAIGVLFPQAARYLGEAAGFDKSYGPSAPGPRAIARSGHFFTYFLHRPLPGAPTRAELEAILDANATAASRQSLVAAISTRPTGDVAPLTHLIALLDEERDEGRIDPQVLFELMEAVVSRGTIRDRGPGSLEDSETTTVRGFVARSLKALGTLTDGQAAAICTVELDLDMLGTVHMLLTIGTKHYLLEGRREEVIINVSDDALIAASNLLVERTLDAIESEEIFSAEIAPRMLFMARTHSPDRVREALGPVFADDRKLVSLLESYRGYADPIPNLALFMGLDVVELQNRVASAYDALDYPVNKRMKWNW